MTRSERIRKRQLGTLAEVFRRATAHEPGLGVMMTTAPDMQSESFWRKVWT